MPWVFKIIVERFLGIITIHIEFLNESREENFLRFIACSLLVHYGPPYPDTGTMNFTIQIEVYDNHKHAFRFFSEMYESREEFFLSFKYVFTKIVGDISLKIWANCANSDTSMKISDKHHDSISFTLMTAGHNFFSRFFFIRNILSNEIRSQKHCLLL